MSKKPPSARRDPPLPLRRQLTVNGPRHRTPVGEGGGSIQKLRPSTDIGSLSASVLALALMLGACGGPWKKGEPWSFGLTRDILDRDWDDGNRQAPSCVDSSSVPHFHGGVEELWVLAFFCMPTAIDIVLLPITG